MLSALSQMDKDKHCMISLLCGVFLNCLISQAKQNEHIDTENRVVVTRGKGGWGEGKVRKGANCQVTDRNWTFAGEDAIV